MSRTLPAPPPGVQLSPVPSMDVHQAVNWCRVELKFPVTVRWLKECTNRGELSAAIVCGRRMYSTQAVYEFAVSRPNKKSVSAQGLKGK